jgi:catechol 2,3-dioxygenase-like lactoylglutathione lyase family enzyme
MNCLPTTHSKGAEMDKPSGRIKGLGEVSLRVQDLERMDKFYQDALGLEVLRREDAFVFYKAAEGYDAHPQVFALFAASEQSFLAAKSSELDPEKSTLHHIAFNLALEDMEAEAARLEGLGLTVQLVEHKWLHVRSLYFNDPEGNTVELVCVDLDAG